MTDTTQDRIARLEARLQDGFDKIGKAMAEGIAVDNWERHFANLLKEYESLDDIRQEERDRAKPEQSAMELGVREVRDVA